jgi:hypothetical protein
MALNALGLFCLEAAAGTGLLLLFFPTGTLGKGFFSLHGAIAFFFTLFAILARPAGLPRDVGEAGAVLFGLYTLAAYANRAALARPLLAAAAGCAGFAMARVVIAAPRLPGGAWTVESSALGGLFFGSVLLVMNLGHWYLVSRALPFQLLSRGATLFAVLAAARTLTLAAAVAVNPAPEGLSSLLSLEKDALFFLFRVAWGILGPLALSLFIWKTADMKSNQAATGLLYVALVFVLIGELLSSYLTVVTGFPA